MILDISLVSSAAPWTRAINDYKQTQKHYPPTGQSVENLSENS